MNYYLAVSNVLDSASHYLSGIFFKKQFLVFTSGYAFLNSLRIPISGAFTVRAIGRVNLRLGRRWVQEFRDQLVGFPGSENCRGVAPRVLYPGVFQTLGISSAFFE